MATCEAYGVPHSVFTGERAPGDKWSSRDAQLAVAYTQFKASLCSGCGVPQHIAWDYKTSHDSRHMSRWEVDEPYRCYVCTAREQATQAFIDDQTRTPTALRFSVKYRRDE